MGASRVVIVNGKVAEEPEVESALEALMSARPAAIHVTSGPGDARRIGREARTADEVIVFGGDGTVNEVIAGLLSPGGAGGDGETGDGESEFGGVFGIVPTGTANDFARCAGIPIEPPSEAVAALEGFRPVEIDLGWASNGEGRLFMNVATGGFGAEVSSEASEELKAVLGKVSYLVAGIAGAGDVEPREAIVSAPGFRRRVAFYLLAIGNARCAGGGMPVCPDADPTDGRLDVTIVPEGAVGATLAEVLRKGLEGVGDAGLRFRTEWLEVETSTPLQINLDGEPASGRHFRFEVRPRAIRVLLPADSPLLRPRPDATSEPPPSSRSVSAPTPG